MVIIIALFYVYCIVGAVVGAVNWMQGNWPKKQLIKDDVALLAIYTDIDHEKTLLFALFCGPLFWVGGLFFIIFRWVVGLLKDKEEIDG